MSATRVDGLSQARPGAVHRTRIVTMTDIPARSVCGLPNSRASRRIFTGTRWTTLTQFPVAFSGGSSEKRAPVPAESELTLPVKARSGTPSTQTSARMPGRIRATWVSLKFASTQTSWSGTIARSGWPIWTTCPTSTERFETTPSIGVRTSVYWSWSSAKARSACVSRSRASACVAAASLIATWWSWLSARASAAPRGGRRGPRLEPRARLVDRRLARAHRDDRPLEGRARLVDRRARFFPSQRQLRARRLQIRLRHRHGGARLRDPRLVVARVDAEQELALLHGLVVADQERGDVAGHLGAHGGDRALDVRVVGRDVVDRVVPGPTRVGDRGQGGESAECPQEPRPHARSTAVATGRARRALIAADRCEPSRGVESEGRGVGELGEVGAFGEIGQERFGHLDLAEHQGVLDANDPRPLGRREPDARERGLDRLAVDVVRRRHLGPARCTGGDCIDEARLHVDLVHEPARGEVGVADADGVAVALPGQVESDDPEDLRIGRKRLVRVGRSADDVRIQAGAGDVLADLLDDQHVHRGEGQPRHPFARVLEQAPLAGLEILRGERLDPGGLVVPVLDEPEAEADPRLRQHLAAGRSDDGLVAVAATAAMVLDRALVPAEPDRHHLEEARLDRPL